MDQAIVNIVRNHNSAASGGFVRGWSAPVSR